MPRAKLVAGIVIVVMSCLMLNILTNDGFNHGLGLDTFLQGARDPWQLFINNDLVSGLLFVVAWITYRERGGRLADTIAWVWLVMWWGNLVVGFYVLLAVYQSAGDPSRFFMGARAGALRAFWKTPSPLARGLCALGAVATATYLAVSLTAVGLYGVPALGYALGFIPIALAFGLLAAPKREAAPQPA